MTLDSTPASGRKLGPARWVVLLAVLLSVLASLQILRPVLLHPRGRATGDGAHPASYGFELEMVGEPGALPASPIVASGFPRDGVPVLDLPSSVAATALSSRDRRGRWKYLVETDLVLGIVAGNRARAYPLRALAWHEAVNDTLGGVPIVVVYSPLGDAAMVFARGDRLYGVSGLLLESNTLLYDRSDPRSLYSPLLGRAITGPAGREGCALRALPSAVMPWSEWLARHPESSLLARGEEYIERYRRAPYRSYYGDDRLRFPVAPLPRGDSPPIKSPVLRLRIDGEDRLYSLSALARRASLGSGRERGFVETTIAGRAVRLGVSISPPSLWLDGLDEEARGETSTWTCLWFAAHASWPDLELDAGLR